MAASELTKPQRLQLKTFASTIQTRLRRVPKGIGLTLNAHVLTDVVDAWTGGEWTRVGSIRGLGSLEVWVDRCTGWKVPQFWYGIGVRDREMARKAAMIGQLVLGQPVVREVEDENTSRPNDNYDRMEPRLPRKDFGRPLLHLHGLDNCGYGVYEFRSVPYPPGALMTLAIRAARFFAAMTLEAAGIASEALDADLTFPPELNARGKPARKGAWKRHGRLMKSRKQKDDYTCRICRIKFRDLYGPMGAGYAQVHHIISLGSEQKSHTHFDELLTVCANCHAMLTRAPVGKAGVAMVRKAFTGKWPR